MAKLFAKCSQNSLYETNKIVHKLIVSMVIRLQGISKVIFGE